MKRYRLREEMLARINTVSPVKVEDEKASGVVEGDVRHGRQARRQQQWRAIAEEILHTPIGQLTERVWGQTTAADLRRFLAQQMEAQIERKLITFPVLEAA